MVQKKSKNEDWANYNNLPLNKLAEGKKHIVLKKDIDISYKRYVLLHFLTFFSIVSPSLAFFKVRNYFITLAFFHCIYKI